MLTATPARIRRVRREAEYARVSNITLLAQRPSAQDGYSQVREGFWDVVADAQVLLDEAATVLMVDRRRCAVETDTPFRLGQTLALTPALPKARVIDKRQGLDRTMMIRGVAIDLGLDRNAIELVG